jgi:hypothetical protein
VIYSVVLRVFRQHALHEVRHTSDWTSVGTTRFVQVVIDPLRLYDKIDGLVTVGSRLHDEPS